MCISDVSLLEVNLVVFLGSVYRLQLTRRKM